KSNIRATRIPSAVTDGGTTWPAGTWFIPTSSRADEIVAQAARELGVNFAAANTRPNNAQAVTPLRVALVDRYGGSMPSGWTRLVLEKFEFPFTVVYPQELDAGNLRSKYDVIVFVSGMVSAGG